MPNKKLTGYPSIDKPWIKFYEDDKRDFVLPNNTLYEYMKHNNKDNLQSIALDYFGNKITYQKLIDMIDIASKSFLYLGVKKGDVVSFCNPTTPEIYIAFYALNKIGAIANMIDPRTNASRIEEFIVNTNSKIVFYIDIAYPKIKDILKKSEIKNCISVSVSDFLPYLLKVGYKLKNHFSKDKLNISLTKNMSWNQFIHLNGIVDENTDLQLDNKFDLPAGIVYTSGTTGIPKGAILSNKNMLAMVYQNICADMCWEKNDRFLGIMPPFIAYGLVCGFVLPLCLGMEITIIPKFELEKFDSYIIKHKPQHIMGVPSYIELLTRSNLLKNVDLSFLKTVIVGGDKINPETEIIINQFLSNHNSKTRLQKGYGLTEISSNAVFSNNNDSNKIGSVGIPLINNNIKVINSNTNEELGYNEVGEICLTGPTLIEGYWDNLEETNNVFKLEDGVRWIHTGDRGYIDEDGVVFFCDRLKRIIVRSDGHNVWPSDSERIIEKHPCIESCCVVGLKDNKAGQAEIVTAFIVIKNDCDMNHEQIIEELKNECLKNLPSRDVPVNYVVKRELPLSGVGKIDYNKLAQEGSLNDN